ncbi:MAG: hypothetical protein RL077_287 [Verrucomicrobiota bacterium]|jgi:hypothetical protein
MGGLATWRALRFSLAAEFYGMLDEVPVVPVRASRPINLKCLKIEENFCEDPVGLA